MKKIIGFLVELLFPKQCLGCNQPGEWLCQQCLGKIKIHNFNQSVFKPSQSLVTTQVLVAANYSQPLLKKLLHSYKYNFIVDLGEILGEILVNFLKTANQQSFDLVMPVPLAKKRLRWREFNQSEILAKYVSQKFSWPLLTEVLIRKYYYHPQVGLSAQKRKNNVRGAFIVEQPLLIKNQRILLIDDVITTGSTMNECAKVLLRAGAREVWGLVIARG